MNTFVFVLLIFVGTFTSSSVQNEIYGEELFLTIFGFESTTDCEICVSQNIEHVEYTTEKLSAAIKEELAGLSDQLEEYQWLIYHEYYGVYLGFSIILFILILALLICRCTHRRQQADERTKKCKKAILSEKYCAVTNYPTCFAAEDKLRKTRKKRQHMVSRQGLIVLKKMRELRGSNKTIDIITQDTCKFVPMEQELSLGKMRVFDLRDRQAIPENVLDTLLCVKPNCTQHCHGQGIRKYGNKIVCDLDKISMDCKDSSFGPFASKGEHHPENILQKAGYRSDLESTRDSPLVRDDVHRYDDLGPPCASSSFISNNSSVSIVFNHSDYNNDPFRYLDETNSPQSSLLQKYVESSITWFGELNNCTETSFSTTRSFRCEDLNQSISDVLDELDNSLDISQIPKNLPLYGFDSGSVFPLVIACLAKQVIRKLKKVLSAVKKSKPAVEERFCQNIQHGNELDAAAFAVYNAKSNE